MGTRQTPFSSPGAHANIKLDELDARDTLKARIKAAMAGETLALPRGGSVGNMAREASNPLKIGVPKRIPSLNTQLEAKVAELEGRRPIHSVLVANNGIAAVKFMRSIRSWAYKTFGDERAVQLVAMATPEDMRIDAEHIRMADQFVEVPAGSNNNNYANVALIAQVADRANVDAVWPGWGHASEKPELPTALADSPSGIVFLGPPAAPMAALGDKIGSTILAQAAGVPTIPWSGSGVAVDFASCKGVIPPEIYKEACIYSVEQAIESCAKIGYPIMLKASWGGGGKGIRKCMNEEDVKNSFKQVQGEVPGSPIFAMKLARASRHLEVQLICDEYGQVTTLFSRDCSVQRRHQKVIEEGPVTKASKETLHEMEKCARALARSVQYVGAATVEFLFDIESSEYFFLELNPRLQVEHPVTEWISNVSIPACQLLIGMGVPLHRIPDIRRLFARDPLGSSHIDFEEDRQISPNGHVVAVRVTSEDANDGFKPTCGTIDELSFRTSPDVWGYFSVKSGGGIHEFSDSQFGHMFAKGETREAAIRAMVVALKEIKIRGEIRTVIDYATEMIQSPEFVGNNIHTGWLDSRIASHVRAEKPVWYLGVIAGAVLQTMDVVASGSAEYLGYLEKGQLPPARLSLVNFKHSCVLEGTKYTVDVSRKGPQLFRLKLGSNSVDVVGRRLNDGGLLIQVDGRTHVVHREEEPSGTRLTIDSLTCLLANETDPSRLIAVSPGKLVRYLVADGTPVKRDQPFVEIEVMKMLMTLLSPADGKVNFQQIEGALLTAGNLIAILDLDDPTAVQSVTDYTGNFPELGPPLVHSSKVDQRYKSAFRAAKNILQGFDNSVDEVIEDLLYSLDDPLLSLLQWDEVFSVVQTRLPTALAEALQAIVSEYQSDLSLVQQGGNSESDEVEEQRTDLPALIVFPSARLIEVMTDAIKGTALLQDRAALESQLEGLLRVARAHDAGKESYAQSVATELFEDYLLVEERFAANKDATEQEVIDSMRKEFSKSLGQVVDIVVSHQGLPLKMLLVSRLMATLVLPAPEHYRPLLRRFAALGHNNNEVSSRARQLLEHSLLSELRAVVARALSGLEMFAGSQLTEMDLLGSEVLQGSENVNSLVKGPQLSRRLTIVEGLYSGLGGGANMSSQQWDAKIKLLVEAPAAVEDALASLLDHHDSTLQKRALLTYIQRVYYPSVVREPELVQLDYGHLAVWLHTSPFDITTSSLFLSMAVVIPALNHLPSALAQAEDVVSQLSLSGTQRGTIHVILTTGNNSALQVSPEAEQFLRLDHPNLTKFVSKFEQGNISHNINGFSDTRDVATAVNAQIECLTPALGELGYQYVSVMSRRGLLVPLRIGLRLEGGSYIPDPLLTAVEPPAARMLELSKLSGFPGRILYHASRNRQCHTYAVTERRDARSLALKRVFSRSVVRQLGKPALLAATYKGDAAGIAFAAMEEVEGTLVNCLRELERLSLLSAEQEAMRADWAHVFLTVLPTLPLAAAKDEVKIALALKSACASLVRRHGAALRRAAVAQFEVRLGVSDHSGAWRLVVSSPTGHEIGEESVAIYKESAENGTVVYRSKHGKMSEEGPLSASPIIAHYPPLEGLQQKRLAARRHKTTYCYDFPSVFGTALRDIWTTRSVSGEPGSMPPGPLVESEELVMPQGSTFSQPAGLLTTGREPGQNDVGVVAWLLTLKTPESPQGRQVVAVANDITYSSGSFGPKEDAVFRAATEYALEERLPLLYLAANSGARVGLANEIKQSLKIEWNIPEEPQKGFQYIYLSENDFVSITGRSEDKVLKAKQITVNGEVRWMITDVVGLEEGLGVECLSGSGAIASAYAKAYKEGLTITLVSGRTVGIGAYLARLGRRCVQRADQPIILTGYAALNKLLGREVYTSHMQLGGPKVMGVNGVSHHVVADDLEGATAVLQWLSTMPAILGTTPPPLASSDPIQRKVEYAPAAGQKLDPRAAIAGLPQAARAGWQGGIFDKNTWQEASSGWAQTVVTGRARLGGIAVGVIAVETNTIMMNVPADPGSPDSAERIVPQAGQVWFPDSALKTAHAMEEFDREALPLIVLANWRGFSGGQRDLFEGVLQAGSLIVENLRTYRQPVIIYLPPGAELRGGAWVVIDGQINPQQVDMYADPGARGGVLEPEGIVEIKFRTPDLIRTMHRLDPVILKLRAEKGIGMEAAIRSREAALLPVYRQVAVAFADMHDTPVRMVAKKVLHGIVPWQSARTFLATRLRRRLAEEEIVRHITTTDAVISKPDALALLQSWYLGHFRSQKQSQRLSEGLDPSTGVELDGARYRGLTTQEAARWVDDKAFLAWIEGAGAIVIASELKALRTRAATRTVVGLTTSMEGRDGLLNGLDQVMRSDGALRAQLASLIARHLNAGNGAPLLTPRRSRQSVEGSIPANHASGKQ